MKYFVEGVFRAGLGDAQVERIGEYDNLADAIVAAKRTIDEFLHDQYREGISAGALFVRYQTVGQVPFIFSDSDTTINVPGFNHFEYAMRRCEEIFIEKKNL